jgi:hypothetical protein
MKVSEHETVPYFPDVVPDYSLLIRRRLRGARRRSLFSHVVAVFAELALYPPYSTEPGDWHDFPFYDTSRPSTRSGDYQREPQSLA